MSGWTREHEKYWPGDISPKIAREWQATWDACEGHEAEQKRIAEATYKEAMRQNEEWKRKSEQVMRAAEASQKDPRIRPQYMEF